MDDDLLVNALIGAAVTVVLSSTGVSPLLGVAPPGISSKATAAFIGVIGAMGML